VTSASSGSTKGTFVNGQKVNKAKLQSGDTIVVGETRIELAIGTGEEGEDAVTKVGPPAQQDIMASSPRAHTPSAPPPMAAASAPPRAAAPPPQPMQSAPPAFAPPPGPSPFAGAPQSAPVLRAPPGHANAGPALYGTAMAPAPGFQANMAGEADDLGGARAVEVAEMLGDSVVGVKHCIDPKGGKVTGTTWALFAIGAASLLAFGFAFWTAVDNAAYNKGRYDYETGVLKKPGFSVRPRMLSGGYDFIAFGGILASLVTCTAALARMRKEKVSPWVRIGTAPGVEFPIEQSPSPDFALVAPHGDDFAFNFGHGMDGEMVVNGQTTTLAELAQQGRTSISPIPANAKIPSAPAGPRLASAFRARAACVRCSPRRPRARILRGC
jgi:hypothetical protein